MWREEYIVAPLKGLKDALDNDNLKTVRAKKMELLAGEFIFPMRDAEALGDQKPASLDDQHHNVVEEEIRGALEGPREGEDVPDQGGGASSGSEARGDPKPIPKLHDQWHLPSGEPVPAGFTYDGSRLVRMKSTSRRPPDVTSSAWVDMSKKQKEAEIVRYERLVADVKEAEAARLKAEAPAMPVYSKYTEPHRQRMMNALDKAKEDIIDGFFALVARPVSAKEVEQNPKAKEAMDREWKKLVEKTCWVESKVKEFEDVARQANASEEQAHFGRIFEICSEKGSELPEGSPNRKFKGRSVFQGNQVVDQNADHALFAELGSAPASMEAGKLIDAFGSQPGYSKQQADARQAYTQALFKGIATWVRLPRNRWPPEWRNKFKDPVVPLRLALYGHPDSGGIWEAHCETELAKVGFQAVLRDIWKSVFYHPELKLLLVVYVDDFKMAGPSSNLKKGWELIGSVLDMDTAEALGRYFGCEHFEELDVRLPKDAHPFAHVFDGGPRKQAAAAPAKEDYWDMDVENNLAKRVHVYPRKRLYVPVKSDFSVFSNLGSARFTVVSANKEVLDDVLQGGDKNMGEWWTGVTYFDLSGRKENEFSLAVAASRKGKPNRSKTEAKKQVKSSRFVTIDQDVQNKVGAMTKKVNRVTYDMKDFLQSCIDRYCELAKVAQGDLKPAATPFHEMRIATPVENENEQTGRLQPIASKVLMKVLFAARMARWDLLRATQSLASRVTKWSRDCDLGLHRLICYIKSSLNVKLSGFVGDSIQDCNLWLFTDSDFAGEYDSKSTTGCAMCLVGPNTYFPLNSFSKKQTSVTMSSTEAEVVAGNQAIRAQGLPSLSMWSFLWNGGVACRKTKPKPDEEQPQDHSIVARIDPELDEIRYGDNPGNCSVANINGLRVQLPKKFAVRVMEDNQAAITLMLSGEAGALRHSDRTQRVSFAWLKQQFANGHFKLLNVGTEEQVADVFTKPFTDRGKWKHALKLIAHDGAIESHSQARGNPKPFVGEEQNTKKTTPAASTDPEAMAQVLLKAKDFSYKAAERLAHMLLAEPQNRARNIIDIKGGSKYLVFGCWVHGDIRHTSCSLSNAL